MNAQGTPAPLQTPACTPEGLGAWEHLLTFDHNFVYVQTAPDNAWLTSGGRVVNANDAGGCFVTIESENSILEGCVTKDAFVNNAQGTPVPQGKVGPEGDGVVEQIYVGLNMTNIMTTAGFRPTKDNGIQTVIDDHNCEVTDTQGEQIPGTLPGQLTAVCAPAYVTIRMLEGDLNLDCQVDVKDDQAIAFLYGATQGMDSYSQWYDLEPKSADGDIDIKDLQFVFGRNYSTCENPSPNDQATPVPPIDP